MSLNEKQSAELTCLAEAAGGRYFGANSASNLLAALSAVCAEVEQKVEKARTTTRIAVTGLGKLNLHMPGASQSISTTSFVRKVDGKTMQKIEKPADQAVYPLPAGEYDLVLGFSNPNYQKSTKAKVGSFTIAGGETTDVALGAVAFNVADLFNKMAVASVTVSNTAPGGGSVTLLKHDNDYYLFKPKPVLPGTYSFQIQYYRSSFPTVLATDIKVQAGRQAVVTLDSGLAIKKPPRV